MRTTVRLNDALFDEAKALAEEQGKTFSALLEDSLRMEIKRSKEPPKRRKVKLPVSKGGGPWPGIDLNNKEQMWAILDGDDFTGR